MVHLFELVPIVLAIIAIYTGLYNLRRVDGAYVKLTIVFGLVASFLLLLAQTSWYSTLVFTDSTIDTSFADKLWFWFNTIAISLIISYSTSHRD